MAASELTVTITMKRRPFWRQLLRTPKVFIEHYRCARKYATVPMATRIAWALSKHGIYVGRRYVGDIESSVWK